MRKYLLASVAFAAAAVGAGSAFAQNLPVTPPSASNQNRPSLFDNSVTPGGIYLPGNAGQPGNIYLINTGDFYLNIWTSTSMELQTQYAAKNIVVSNPTGGAVNANLGTANYNTQSGGVMPGTGAVGGTTINATLAGLAAQGNGGGFTAVGAGATAFGVAAGGVMPAGIAANGINVGGTAVGNQTIAFGNTADAFSERFVIQDGMRFTPDLSANMYLAEYINVGNGTASGLGGGQLTQPDSSAPGGFVAAPAGIGSGVVSKNNFYNGTSWVNLSSASMGTLYYGFQYSESFYTWAAAAADTGNFVAQGFQQYNGKMVNGFRYVTPNFGGTAPNNGVQIALAAGDFGKADTGELDQGNFAAAVQYSDPSNAFQARVSLQAYKAGPAANESNALTAITGANAANAAPGGSPYLQQQYCSGAQSQVSNLNTVSNTLNINNQIYTAGAPANTASNGGCGFLTAAGKTQLTDSYMATYTMPNGIRFDGYASFIRGNTLGNGYTIAAAPVFSAGGAAAAVGTPATTALAAGGAQPTNPGAVSDSGAFELAATFPLGPIFGTLGPGGRGPWGTSAAYAQQVLTLSLDAAREFTAMNLNEAPGQAVAPGVATTALFATYCPGSTAGSFRGGNPVEGVICPGYTKVGVHPHSYRVGSTYTYSPVPAITFFASAAYVWNKDGASTSVFGAQAPSITEPNANGDSQVFGAEAGMNVYF